MFDCCLVKSYSQKKRQKKGPSLVYQFQRSMESGDASDEEAPPCDPKSNNQTKKDRSKAISMVVDMETKDGLKRRAVMVVAKKFGWQVQTYSTMKIKIFFFCYVLLLNSELGLSISSEFFHAKKLLFTPLVFLFSFFLLRQFIFYSIFLLMQLFFILIYRLRPSHRKKCCKF